MSTPCVLFCEIGVFTTPGGVAAEGGERSEDGGAQGESENTPISSSGQQEAEKLIEKDIEKSAKIVIPISPY